MMALCLHAAARPREAQRATSRRMASVCAHSAPAAPDPNEAGRRATLTGLAAAALVLSSGCMPASAAIETETEKVLCDAACLAALEKLELVTLPSGLQYRDIVVGKGPTPQIGYQVHP